MNGIIIIIKLKIVNTKYNVGNNKHYQYDNIINIQIYVKINKFIII